MVLAFGGMALFVAAACVFLWPAAVPAYIAYELLGAYNVHLYFRCLAAFGIFCLIIFASLRIYIIGMCYAAIVGTAIGVAISMGISTLTDDIIWIAGVGIPSTIGALWGTFALADAILKTTSAANPASERSGSRFLPWSVLISPAAIAVTLFVPQPTPDALRRLFSPQEKTTPALTMESKSDEATDPKTSPTENEVDDESLAIDDSAPNKVFSVSFAEFATEPVARLWMEQNGPFSLRPFIVPITVDGVAFYRVAIGPYSTRDSAEAEGRKSGIAFTVDTGAAAVLRLPSDRSTRR